EEVLGERGGIGADVIGGDGSYGINAVLSADPASAGGVEGTRRGGRDREGKVEHVIRVLFTSAAGSAAVDRRPHVRAAGDHAFAEEVSSGEFVIMAGDSIRIDDRCAIISDLQRHI